MAFEHMNSVLVADIGNAHTRLVLIDLVEGKYRLIASSRARTTAQPPLNSVGLGLEHAAQIMTSTIGRTLIDPDPERLFKMPEEDGHGVDGFVATSSAGRPMRVFLVGVTPEISLTSGRRALGGAYVTITGMLGPHDTRSDTQKINAILRDDPDMILIVGGTDDGADDILLDQVRLVARALSLIRRGTMPTVLFAGNQAVRKAVRAILNPITEVYTARNVRPTLDEEQLFPAQLELALVYDDYRAKSPGGFAEVGRQSQIGIVPTTQGYLSAMRYMTALSERPVGPLCIDIGSSNSMMVTSIDGEVQVAIRSDLGMGHSMVSTLERLGAEHITRWLPFDLAERPLLDYVHNKQLRPTTIPATSEELMLEQAFARAITVQMIEELRPSWNQGRSLLLPPFSPIIAAGAILTEAQHPGISALMLLDALQPVGITELRLDPHNLLSALGVVAYLKPVMMVQALEAGGLVTLGTAFCPLGHVRQAKDAMTIRVRLPDGRVLNKRLLGGDLWMAPVLPGIACEVEIRLRRGLSINGKQRIRQRVMAGAAGIIFDARGRPFNLPRPRDRVARYLRWQQAMTGQEPGVAPPEPPPPDEALIPDLGELTGLEDRVEVR